MTTTTQTTTPTTVHSTPLHRPANAALVAAQATYNAAMDALNAAAAKHTARSWAKALAEVKAPYSAAVQAALDEDAAALHQNSDFGGQGEGGRSTPQSTTPPSTPSDTHTQGTTTPYDTTSMRKGDVVIVQCEDSSRMSGCTGTVVEVYGRGNHKAIVEVNMPDGTKGKLLYDSEYPFGTTLSTITPWTPTSDTPSEHLYDGTGEAMDTTTDPRSTCTECGVQVPSTGMRCEYCHTNGLQEEDKASNHTHCATTPCLSCQAEIAEQEALDGEDDTMCPRCNDAFVLGRPSGLCGTCTEDADAQPTTTKAALARDLEKANSRVSGYRAQYHAAKEELARILDRLTEAKADVKTLERAVRNAR